jgi:hypothetical protein
VPILARGFSALLGGQCAKCDSHPFTRIRLLNSAVASR